MVVQGVVQTVAPQVAVVVELADEGTTGKKRIVVCYGAGGAEVSFCPLVRRLSEVFR